MNDRIKLAEAMGWSKRCAVTNRLLFNPFTDANDDYAVRDHFVKIGKAEALGDALHDLIILRRDPTANPNNYGLTILNDAVDIKIGDWSRAALKVLDE